MPTHPPLLCLLGSNTDIGKTWLGVRLFRALQSRVPGLRGLKPIESGWEADSSDAGKWAAAHNPPVSIDEVCRWKLPRPVTPASEFARLNNEPDEDTLAREIRRLADGYPALIETAGGVASPITSTIHSASLARLLGASSMVVSGAGLGCISACVTAVQFASDSGAKPVAIVLNERRGDDPTLTSSNQEWIEAATSQPVFIVRGEIPEALIELVARILHSTDQAAR